MKIALYQYQNKTLLKDSSSDLFAEVEAQLVLCFGAKTILADHVLLFSELKEKFPAANIVTCSTAGEIFNNEVFDDSVTITVIRFAATTTKAQIVTIEDYANSFDAGIGLTEQFSKDGLVYLLVLSDGSKVNGSELVRGLNSASSHQYLITGGLAGDSDRFVSTLVGLNEVPKEGAIVGIGFYGDNIKVSHGSLGGWEMFGLEKTVTRSVNNVLFEIDHKNALELYKTYLGKEAGSLPGSALLFPLSVILPDTGDQVVRTILSINESAGSMTFAGDIPEGSVVRFMKANFDKIISAASTAATQSLMQDKLPPQLALLISCVGRKLILQSRTDEEIEAINEIFERKTKLTGFYSYGEISPIVNSGSCNLHNQTMTITTFNETE